MSGGNCGNKNYAKIGAIRHKIVCRASVTAGMLQGPVVLKDLHII